MTGRERYDFFVQQLLDHAVKEFRETEDTLKRLNKQLRKNEAVTNNLMKAKAIKAK